MGMIVRRYGDETAPAATSSTPAVWSPGLMIAVLALALAWYMKNH